MRDKTLETKLTRQNVTRAVNALITTVGRHEANRRLVAGGIGPSVSDKLCRRSYKSELGEDNSRYLLQVLKEAGVRLGNDKAS